jgi:hypothetical protein
MSDATDFLPGLDDQFDGNNNDFVEDYILGNPFMYREEYNSVSSVQFSSVQFSFVLYCIVLYS